MHLSPPVDPPILKGIKVHADNPFEFDFILDKGDSELADNALKDESSKLIKYFLASLTIPEKDLWVNLSPYEKDRIIPNSFGLTEMGRDLLAEDYMLKQITASLIYPEGEIGKKFWKSIYEQAAKQYGTTNVPVNTFNKVWIVPEKAVVYENAKAGTAYVVESRLKVMLEQDYLSLEKHEGVQSVQTAAKSTSQLGSNIVREIVLPELTREVNEDKNFSRLRQVYNSLILATWYKKKIKDSILAQVYSDKNKIAGVNISDPQEKEEIYQRYLKAFKKGVFNYIKEEQDGITQESIPRKYFSGGLALDMSAAMTVTESFPKLNGNLLGRVFRLAVGIVPFRNSQRQSGEGFSNVTRGILRNWTKLTAAAITLSLAGTGLAFGNGPTAAPQTGQSSIVTHQTWSPEITEMFNEANGTSLKEGIIEKSEFSKWPNGASNLSTLIAEGILEDISPSEARYKISADLSKMDIKERDDWDKSWELLRKIRNKLWQDQITSVEQLKDIALKKDDPRSKEAFFALLELMKAPSYYGNWIGNDAFNDIVTTIHRRSTWIDAQMWDGVFEVMRSYKEWVFRTNLPGEIKNKPELLGKLSKVIEELLLREEPNQDRGGFDNMFNAFELVQEINKKNPDLIKASPLLSFVASLDLGTQKAHAYANYGLWYFPVLNNGHFQSVVSARKLSWVEEYSVAVSVTRALVRYGLEPNDESRGWMTDQIMSIRDQIASRSLFKGVVINMLHESVSADEVQHLPGFNSDKMIRFELQHGDGLDPKNIHTYRGPDQKQAFLDDVADNSVPGPKTLFINAHGGKDAILIGNFTQQRAQKDPTGQTTEITFTELAQALKKYEDNGGKLNDMNIFTSQCQSYTYFAKNLLSSLSTMGAREEPLVEVDNDIDQNGLENYLDQYYRTPVKGPFRMGQFLNRSSFLEEPTILPGGETGFLFQKGIMFVPLPGGLVIPPDLKRIKNAPLSSPVTPALPSNEIEIGEINGQSINAAMTTPKALNQTVNAQREGGIDLTAEHMPLEIKNAGQGINFHLDAAMLKEFQNAQGFVPEVDSIEPMNDLKAFLGVTS